MVFTHLPSNAMLIVAAFMPTAPLAMGALLIRSLTSQMDVAARQSYVMAVVPPEERAAAATVTNVPRSLASAFAPLPAGAMLNLSSFGWPLICAGTLKDDLRHPVVDSIPSRKAFGRSIERNAKVGA